MATDHRVKNATMVALSCVGVLLIALPWIDRPDGNPLPSAFAAGSPAHLHLLACIRRVDDCCRRGDLAAFRDVVTPGYAADLELQLQQLDRHLDSRALTDLMAGDRRNGLLGDLQRLQFVAGGSRVQVACLIYDYGDHAAFDGVKLLRLRWDGYRFRLDQVRDVRRSAGVDRGAWVGVLLQNALSPN